MLKPLGSSGGFSFPLDSVAQKNYSIRMGLRLREIREKKGLSLRQLAEQSGVAFGAINRIELGKTTPRLETLERLAKALGVGVKSLIVNGK